MLSHICLLKTKREYIYIFFIKAAHADYKIKIILCKNL